LLPEIPAAATALGEAIAALRQERDPRPGLEAARRSLSTYPSIRPSVQPPISPWGGAW